MTVQTDTRFSHVKPGDTPWRSDGLRDFFLYRDLGVAAATPRSRYRKKSRNPSLRQGVSPGLTCENRVAV